MAEPAIRLHHAHGTRSQRVLWLLYELGVPFELQIWPFDKTLRSPEFARLNPVGRVPALEVNGAVILESGAMVEHLCELFPEAALGRAIGDPDRGAWLQWVHFAETISVHAANLTQQHVMLYDDSQRSPIIMNLEARRLAKTLSLIEAALDGPYLLGDAITAADIGTGQAADMATRFVRLDEMPKVAAWLGRLRAREAFQKAAPPEGQGIYHQEFYAPWPMD